MSYTVQKAAKLTAHEADYNFYVVHCIGLDIHVQHSNIT